MDGTETLPERLSTDDIPDDPPWLNVGAGGTQIEGFTPVDIKSGVDARRLPYDDGSVGRIYCSHMLEHVGRAEFPAVLREFARVLRPGGLLQVAVPDLARLCRDRTPMNRWMIDSIIYGGQTDEHDRHGWGFDADSLAVALRQAGLGGVEPFEPFADDCSKHPYSLNLQGRKRWWEPIDKPRLALVLCTGRLGFSSHALRWMQTAWAIGHSGRYAHFAVEPSHGAFWDRDMTCTTEAAIAKHDPDFLVYTDWDSVLEPGDVEALVDHLNADPTLAAVSSVQMSRHDDEPLVFDPALDYTGVATGVRFAHFGLTVIRPDVFKEMEHPWFWSTPGANGRWDGWPRSDGDITFWRRMDEYGFRVEQRNDVVIGHLVEAVKWPRGSGAGVMLQPESAYLKRGRPPEARLDADVYRRRRAENAKRASERAAQNGRAG